VILTQATISISKISLSYRCKEFNRHSQVAGADTELFQGEGMASIFINGAFPQNVAI